MPDIKDISPKELLQTHLLSSPDFDLMSFIPTTLSKEENNQAIDKIIEYCQLITDKAKDFLDLYDEKKKVNEDIKTTEAKMRPGCFTKIGLIIVALLITSAVLSMVLALSVGSSQGDRFAGLFFLLFFPLWGVSYFKLKKLMINQKDKKHLAALQKRSEELSGQLTEAKKLLGYEVEADEESVYNGVIEESLNLSEITTLLEKRDIILKDTTLSPSAVLLAIEQLYATIRQEKHNKAMEEAAYNSAERIAAEMAEQENANRILSAFLTGYLSTRDK